MGKEKVQRTPARALELAPDAAGKESKVAVQRSRSLRGQTFEEGSAALAPQPRAPVQAKGGSGRNSYVHGQHGAKKAEQTRLSDKFGTPVSGETHESEHTIGFEPLNQTAETKRGEAGAAKDLENRAWAYQEVRPFHRTHIGTGTKGSADASGFTSKTYRDSQRSLIEQRDVSSAVQINQLGYAFDPRFQQSGGETGTRIANDSYDTMVTNMDEVTYAKGAERETVGVDARQKVEMYLARRAAQTGKFPTEEEEDEARKLFGLPTVQQEKEEKAAKAKASE